MTYTITQTLSSETLTLNDVTVDGYITYNREQGTYTKTTSPEWNYTGPYGKSTATYRSFFEWDISSIPTNADITRVDFLYDCFIRTGSSGSADAHIHECHGQQPSVASASDLWTETSEGTAFAAVDGFPVEGENQSVNLGATAAAEACMSVERRLGNENWFAIGLQCDTEEDREGVYSAIDGEARSGAARPKPTLHVTYDLTAVSTLNDPANISISHRRIIQQFRFWDGSYSVSDWGRATKGLVIQGVEYSSATTRMKEIEDMMERGDHVTLGGLPDSEHNTDYMISDISYERRGGNVGIYEYTLSLEKYED